MNPIVNSRLADHAPELVVALLIVSIVLAGIWRIVEKVQFGQETIVDKFLGHQAEIVKEHSTAMERVQSALDRNTEMLGKNSSALDHASYVMERLEGKLGLGSDADKPRTKD